MRTRNALLAALAFVALYSEAPAARAGLFVVGSTYTVSGNNSPTDFSTTVTFHGDGTTTSLAGGKLNFSENVIPVNGSTAYLQTNWETSDGSKLAGSLHSFWQLKYTNLQLATKVVRAGPPLFYFWYDHDGTPLTGLKSAYGYSVTHDPLDPSIEVFSVSFTFPPTDVIAERHSNANPYDTVLGNLGIDASKPTGFHFLEEFTAVPEPTGITLAAAGCLALTATVIRRKSALAV